MKMKSHSLKMFGSFLNLPPRLSTFHLNASGYARIPQSFISHNDFVYKMVNENQCLSDISILQDDGSKVPGVKFLLMFNRCGRYFRRMDSEEGLIEPIPPSLWPTVLARVDEQAPRVGNFRGEPTQLPETKEQVASVVYKLLKGHAFLRRSENSVLEEWVDDVGKRKARSKTRKRKASDR